MWCKKRCERFEIPRHQKERLRKIADRLHGTQYDWQSNRRFIDSNDVNIKKWKTQMRILAVNYAVEQGGGKRTLLTSAVCSHFASDAGQPTA